MEADIVSVSAGVITSLPEKLRSLEVRSGQREKMCINSLQNDLALLGAALLDSVRMEARNMQVQEWSRQAREVAYDIDDYIDLHQHHLQSKIFSPTRSLFNRFEEQIKLLQARVIQVIKRLKRFDLAVSQVPRSDASIATAAAHRRSSSVTIDPQLLFSVAEDPVAIQGPAQELLEFLDGNSSSSSSETRHVQVVSIVGMAGIGKTTLALQVYGALEERFHSRAFVRVGPRPSLTAVLLDIISQVTDKPHKHEDMPDERSAIMELSRILRDRRYLVVVDDIWSISAWKAINCALPQNSTGSRIIVTTRVHDVARSCSNHPSDKSYEMKTLNKPDTISLFHRRMFGSKDKCQKSECSQIHGIILRICGGLPWAIIVVASFLAMKEPKEWMMVNKSTLSALKQQPLLERMEKVLHLSYTDLSFSIKTCLLYLSVFPKNYEINKDRLIWRWIAEGFVPRSEDEGVWETGRSYFNELINRNLIQPIVKDEDVNEDDPMGCTVHDIIHDFVVSLSKEENFVTSDELESRPRDLIRRLSLNYNNQDTESTMFALLKSRSVNLSQARSLTILGRPPQRMPHTLANFQLLRVLDLEDAEGLDNADLKDIGRLFNLRYLGLGGKRVTKLPEGIRKLQLLETLEIRRTEVRELPPGAGQLQKLVRLLAKALDVIPAGVLKKMKELQELSVVSVNSPRALNLLEELAMMERLRILEIKWGLRERDSDIQGYKNQFVTFLNGASKSNIKSLSIYCDEACSIDFVADCWDPHPPYLLQKLVMHRSEQCFCRIPKTLAWCQVLAYLEIAINLDVEEDLLIMANLRSLTSLKLSARGKPIVIRQGFECLKVFWFQRWEADLGLLFEAGAMPQLRKLSLHFKVPPHQPQFLLETEQQEHGRRFGLGLQHLPSLKQVNVKIDCDGAMHTDVASVEKAIEKHMHVDGRYFKFELSRENEDKMKQDRVEGAAQEECN